MSAPASLKGLTHPEAAERLRRSGPNSAGGSHRVTPVMLVLAQLRSPLTMVLLACAALAAYFGESISAVLIVGIVLVSAALDFVNSYRSDRAAEKLKERVRVTCMVRREGKEEEVPVAEVVPGDIVLLSAGDIVPADGVVRESSHCYTNESALTGEAYPQPKDVGATVFMGSSIATGRATVEVTVTGPATQFSKVVASLSQTDVETEFDREIAAFSFLVVRITLVLAVFVFVVNAWLKGDLLGSLLFAVALAVGITPELLPMIITLNLTKGSLAMAKHGVIVKRLSSIQNLGSMDVLCTDKTGTLTEDKIALVKHVNGHGETCERVLRAAYLSSALTSGFQNPLDEAIRDFKHLPVSSYEKLDELPFDFSRRRESVVARHAGKTLLIAKGSPEGILKVCTHYKDGEKMKGSTLEFIHNTYTKLSKGGFRVLGVAEREVPEQGSYQVSDEAGLTFLGFVAFLDPPKLTVEKTLRRLREYGIAIKVITGDNELVSQRIAQEIKLEVTGLLLGSDVDALSDSDLTKRAETTSLFARVNPDQKQRVIKALQAGGHVVGYMGDGINDAPSLKRADVGISVNNATDIAKESADMILLHKSLDELVDGVIEGRRTFANTLKYLRMVLSSNFGNVFSMAGASLFLPFLPMLPTQILLNNLMYDASQFTIPTDTVDEEDLRLPRKLDTKELRRFMMVFGPLSSLFDFATFGVLLAAHLSVPAFQAGWFVESLATQIFVVYVIRTRKVPFLQSVPSAALLLSTLGMVGVGWLVALTPLGRVFQFAPVGGGTLLAIAAIVALYLVVIELAKQRFYQAQGPALKDLA